MFARSSPTLRKAVLGVAMLASVASSGFVAAGAAAGPRPPAGGAVASAEKAATDVGVAILAQGGNAADAAVAVALALAVVHPQAGNLGGGGFALARFSGSTYALDFRETAPGGATADMFLGPDGRPVPERSLVGPLAVGTPGSPRGFFELHRRFGRLPWAEVVAPARRLAGRGFIVSERLSRTIREDRALLSRYPETAAVWLPQGQPPAAGAVMKLPRLAKTLDEYAHGGPDALLAGRGAAAIETAVKRRGGSSPPRTSPPTGRSGVNRTASAPSAGSSPPCLCPLRAGSSSARPS